MGKDGYNRVYRLFIAMNRSLIMQIFRSTLSSSEQQNMINEIIHDSIWAKIWSFYPIKTMPFKHRIFLWAIYRNCFICLKFLSKIGNRK